MLRLSIALLAASLALGCSKKKTEGDKQASTASKDTPAVPKAPAVRKQVTEITVDEVKALMPSPDGGKVIKEVQKTPIGQRVETSFCFDTDKLTEVADKVKAKLTEAGWPTVNVTQPPSLKDRVLVSAQKPPYFLSGTTQKSAVPECPGEKGKTYVHLGVSKLETRPVTGAPPGGMPGGPPGAGGPGRPMPPAPMGGQPPPAPPSAGGPPQPAPNK